MVFVWLRKLLAPFQILILFLAALTVSSFKLIIMIYSPTGKIRSGFFEIPLPTTTLWHRIVIAHFISLTPGTLSIEILESDHLLVHAMDLVNRKAVNELVQKKLGPLLRVMSDGGGFL